MTDKEILEEVYQMVSNGYVADIQDDVKSFIEQEWQKEDEKKALDAQEIERHRGLVIEENGTVKDIN